MNEPMDYLGRIISVEEVIKGNLLIGIGDLHGHYPALESLLTSLDNKYSIFEGQDSLKKGVSIVTTGDYIDRGQESLKIIERFKRISKNSPGKIKNISGNHELMALADYDYAVSIAEDSKMPLDEWSFTRYAMMGGNDSLHGYNGGVQFLKEFGDSPKEAFENYAKRMSNKGDIGKWIRNLKPCFIAHFNGKNILFTHADIPASINNEMDMRKFIEDYLVHIAISTKVMGGSQKKYANEGLIKGSTIFWERRFDMLGQNEIKNLLNNLNADYLVFGHTPHDKITSYYGKAFDIDVGMTPAYGENEPTAIVFKKDGIYGFYANSGEEKLIEF